MKSRKKYDSLYTSVPSKVDCNQSSTVRRNKQYTHTLNLQTADSMIEQISVKREASPSVEKVNLPPLAMQLQTIPKRQNEVKFNIANLFTPQSSKESGLRLNSNRLTEKTKGKRTNIMIMSTPRDHLG